VAVPTRPYHHGSLRPALMTAALGAIAEVGPSALSMRDVARRAGVSHAASAHHFGDKAGLLTALAAQGYQLLADELDAARERTGRFLEVGVAYVRFAVDHPAHFAVMFRPDLYSADDPAVLAAKVRASAALRGGLEQVPGERTGSDARLAGIAAWSIVHGFASLWLDGALSGLGDDPEPVARAVAGLLFRPPDGP
jgi:AcrR family transcriptional regulator